jgi:iron complex transport system permease protein
MPRRLTFAGTKPHTPVTFRYVTRVVTQLFILLILVCLLSLAMGPGNFLLPDMTRLFFTDHAGIHPPSGEIIFFSIRLPRILFAAVVGASLSLAGVVFQAVLRNPLADPYILGVSGGAALGAVLATLFVSSLWSVPLLAFAGTLVTIFLIFGFSWLRYDHEGHTLLLTGVVINAFFSALLMFFFSISKSDQAHSILFWLMGNVSMAESREIILTAIVMAAGFIFLFIHARALNILSLGDETAMQLGVNAGKTKILLLVTASLVTATAVSMSGTIGFIGLVVPHLTRILFGPDHRVLLPVSLLSGAIFMVAADTMARTLLAPVELPVGVITALCGAPYFLYLLHTKRTSS